MGPANSGNPLAVCATAMENVNEYEFNSGKNFISE
jgi:hypothetical protein